MDSIEDLPHECIFLGRSEELPCVLPNGVGQCLIEQFLPFADGRMIISQPPGFVVLASRVWMY